MKSILGDGALEQELSGKDLSLDTVNIRNLMVYSPITTINNSVATTLTAAQIVNGVIIRTWNGSTQINDPLPSAAELISYIGNVNLFDSFGFTLKCFNNNSQLCFIGVGAGGTAETFLTATAGAKAMATYRIVFTNITPGAEAYSFFRESYFTAAFG